MKTIGRLLLVPGVLGALYFFVLFDTSVLVPESETRVNNIGLMNTRLIGVIICLFAVLIGVVLVIAGAVGDRRMPGEPIRRSSEFPTSTRFGTSNQTMADRLEELERRKQAVEQSDSDQSLLAQLKRNAGKE